MVLTRSGWRSLVVIHREFEEARVSGVELPVIEVSSFDHSTSTMEWKRVTAAQRVKADKHSLYRMQGEGMDVVATEDHNMVTGRLHSHSQLVAGTIGFESVAQLLGRAYSVRPSAKGEAPSLTQFGYDYTRAVVRCAANRQVDYELSIAGMPSICAWWWKRDQQRGFLRFIGFWLGNGSLNVESGNVTVSQRKLAATAWLIDLLDEVFPRWWYRTVCSVVDVKGITFNYNIRCPPLYEYFRQMAVGPPGYHPEDPVQLRKYPHFDFNAVVDRDEAASAHGPRTAAHRWTEEAMLAAFDAGGAVRRPCCGCGDASGVRLSCSGRRCQQQGDGIARAHPTCVDREDAAAFDTPWYCSHSKCQKEAAEWSAAHPSAAPPAPSEDATAPAPSPAKRQRMRHGSAPILPSQRGRAAKDAAEDAESEDTESEGQSEEEDVAEDEEELMPKATNKPLSGCLSSAPPRHAPPPLSAAPDNAGQDDAACDVCGRPESNKSDLKMLLCDRKEDSDGQRCLKGRHYSCDPSMVKLAKGAPWFCGDACKHYTAAGAKRRRPASSTVDVCDGGESEDAALQDNDGHDAANDEEQQQQHHAPALLLRPTDAVPAFEAALALTDDSMRDTHQEQQLDASLAAFSSSVPPPAPLPSLFGLPALGGLARRVKGVPIAPNTAADLVYAQRFAQLEEAAAARRSSVSAASAAATPSSPTRSARLSSASSSSSLQRLASAFSADGAADRRSSLSSLSAAHVALAASARPRSLRYPPPPPPPLPPPSRPIPRLPVLRPYLMEDDDEDESDDFPSKLSDEDRAADRRLDEKLRALGLEQYDVGGRGDGCFLVVAFLLCGLTTAAACDYFRQLAAQLMLDEAFDPDLWASVEVKAEHVYKMRKPRGLAGGEELAALSCFLHRNFVVHRAGAAATTMGTFPLAIPLPIAHVYGNHWRVVRRLRADASATAAATPPSTTTRPRSSSSPPPAPSPAASGERRHSGITFTFTPRGQSISSATMGSFDDAFESATGEMMEQARSRAAAVAELRRGEDEEEEEEDEVDEEEGTPRFHSYSSADEDEEWESRYGCDLMPDSPDDDDDDPMERDDDAPEEEKGGAGVRGGGCARRVEQRRLVLPQALDGPQRGGHLQLPQPTAGGRPARGLLPSRR